MKRLIAVLGLCLVATLGCDVQVSVNPPPPVSEINPFVFVDTQSSSSPMDLNILDAWLRRNPQKKVVGISPVSRLIGNRNDNIAIPGYIIWYEPGSNINQHLIHVSAKDQAFVFGIGDIASWRKTHKAAHIISFCALPGLGGEVSQFLVCYEDQ